MRYTKELLFVDYKRFVKEFNLETRVKRGTRQCLQESNVCYQVPKRYLLIFNNISRNLLRDPNRFKQRLKDASKNVVVFNFSADNESDRNKKFVLLLIIN